MERFRERTGVITPTGFISPVADNITILPQNDICGLTKQEYMALELTKAWASTRCNGHEYVDEIVSAYEKVLSELKVRGL